MKKRELKQRLRKLEDERDRAFCRNSDLTEAIMRRDAEIKRLKRAHVGESMRNAPRGTVFIAKLSDMLKQAKAAKTAERQETCRDRLNRVLDPYPHLRDEMHFEVGQAESRFHRPRVAPEVRVMSTPQPRTWVGPSFSDAFVKAAQARAADMNPPRPAEDASPFTPYPGVDVSTCKGLHPMTRDLLDGFCATLKAKARTAEVKYGYRDDWSRTGWDMSSDAAQHFLKGDPVDVAIYMAFMWHHGVSTVEAAEKLRNSNNVTISNQHQTIAAMKDRIADLTRHRDELHEKNAELYLRAQNSEAFAAENVAEGAAASIAAMQMENTILQGQRDEAQKGLEHYKRECLRFENTARDARARQVAAEDEVKTLTEKLQRVEAELEHVRPAVSI